MENKVERWWDASAIFTLIAAVWIVVWRIQATGWIRDLYRLETLVIIALLLGIFLGKSRFKSRIVGWMCVYYTAFFITWQLGLTMGDDIVWPERLASIIGRLLYSISLLAQNKPVLDPLLFLALLSLLFWMVSLAAGYQMVRNGRPWVPLFISAVALVSIDYYDANLSLRTWFDGTFILLSLLLISRVFFLHSRKEWEDRGAVIDPDAGLNVGGSVFFGGLIVIIIAWNIPFFSQALSSGSDAQERTIIAWGDFRNRLGNIVAGVQGKPVYEATTYANQINLGTGQQLGDNVIFEVSVPEKRPEGKQYYWRGYSYDHYALGNWRSTQEILETKKPRDWDYSFPGWVGRQLITFFITPESPLQRTIFAPDIPLSASRTVRVLRANLPDVSDLVSIQADSPLQPGEIFSMDSWVSVPTVEQLRSAGINYPEWVTSRYLALPDQLPKRIKDLATVLTSGRQTQYEKVMAITSYLRTTITYQQVIPNPPTNQDPIDWFLFDYKKGFCNYYASAEVLMLRTIGIPARLAIGYAEGTSDQTGNKYTVLAHDGHAWPEVYFDNVGWVEFEPTTSQPATNLPQGGDSGLVNDENQNFDPNLIEPRIPRGLQGEWETNSGVNPTSQPNFLDRFGWPVFYFVLLAGLFISLWYIWRRLRLHLIPVWVAAKMRRRGLSVPGWLERLAWRAQLSQMEWMYLQISWMLHILGRRDIPAQTPSERSELLIKLLPSSNESGRIFLEEYLKAEYSPHSVDFSRAQRAYREMWKKVLIFWFGHVTGIMR